MTMGSSLPEASDTRTDRREAAPVSSALKDVLREALYPFAARAAKMLLHRPSAKPKKADDGGEDQVADNLGSLTALARNGVNVLRNAAASRLSATTTPDNDLRPVRWDHMYPEEAYPGGMTLDELRWLKGLYPSQEGLLDAHTMGRPSFAAVTDTLAHFLHWEAAGVESWGEFMKTKQKFRELVSELVGAQPKAVLHGPNATDLHRMLFMMMMEKPVIAFDADHFSTMYKMMGGQELPKSPAAGDAESSEATATRDAEGPEATPKPRDDEGSPSTSEPTEKNLNVTKVNFHDPDFVIAPNTTIVPISHGGYKSGKVLNLKRVTDRIREQAPDALMVIDVYQTAGTVPINVDELGPNIVVIGGGHKQLHSAAGAGFAAFSKGTIEKLKVLYPGWWSEEDGFVMWNYVDGPSKPIDPTSAARLQGGSSDFFAQSRLVVELEILKKLGGGSIQEGINKVRGKSLYQLGYMRFLLRDSGLECVSPEDPNALPSYLVYKHPQAKDLEKALRAAGVCVDSRAEKDAQFLRISTNKALSDADIQKACEIIKDVVAGHAIGAEGLYEGALG